MILIVPTLFVGGCPPAVDDLALIAPSTVQQWVTGGIGRGRALGGKNVATPVARHEQLAGYCC